ncbi:scavenger receptor class B member 1 [Anoplolepis gracilipes]|uniref:scavenger receptor class B member 1 n=1 Tax=Anoplolepis gracilipes TaxID=354296 RepID=UPI003B9F212F
MTISVADTVASLDIEKKAMKHCTRRNRLHFWLAWIYCGMFLMSFACFYIFWYTDAFANYVFSQMELRNGSHVFEFWQHPPIQVEYRIRVFNYTNVKEFEAGMVKKLRVQELGPYVYRETKDRVNVVIHENGTMTFQEKRSYMWVGGRPDSDTVMVPNVPLMFATAFVRDLSFPVRFVTNTVLSTLQEQTFINETVNGFLWGYDNRLFHMVKPLMMLKRDIPFDKFGMLATRKGVSKDRFTIKTNLDEFGVIERVNGIDNRKIWDDEKCDRIMGSDGSMFPPHIIQDTSKILYVYSHEMCRNLPFHFVGQATTYNIPSLRYKFTPDAYNFTDPQNKCFCPKVNGIRVCPPSGLFNVSACNFGAPLLSSFPHFYGANKSLLKQVDGLNPRQEDHDSYVDLHPRIAAPMAGWSRLQLNLEVRSAIGVPFLGKLKDGMILPLFWMEMGVDEVPESVLELLQSAHFTVTNVEMALQWCSLLIMMISLSATIACLWKYRVQ